MNGLTVFSKYRPVSTSSAAVLKPARPLPKAFQSGAVLLASCWTERYRLLKGSNVVPSERLLDLKKQESWEAFFCFLY